MPHAKAVIPPPPSSPPGVAVPPALLYGWGVYTSLMMPSPPTLLGAHLARLRRDAQTLGMRLGRQDIKSICRALDTMCRAGPGPWRLRLTIYPNVSDFRELTSQQPLPPAWHCQQQPWTPAALCQADFIPTLALVSAPFERPLPHVKHMATGPAFWLKRHLAPGPDTEVLWSNRAGHVCEATTANVFAILKNGHLWTPQPHLDACLPGLTRRWLLRRAMPALGLQATLPGSCDVETLLPQTDGLFLTNAVCGLQAVASLDGQRFSWPAKARSIFTRLQQSWHEANCPTLGRIDSA